MRTFATHKCERHNMDSPSPSSQPPSPDLGLEFDAPSPTATASPVSSPYDLIPDTPEFENSSEPVTNPFYHPLQQVAEVGRSARRPKSTAIPVRQQRYGMRTTLVASQDQPLLKRSFAFRTEEEIKTKITVSVSPSHQILVLVCVVTPTKSSTVVCKNAHPVCLVLRTAVVAQTWTSKFGHRSGHGTC